jgi:hypothetical protein
MKKLLFITILFLATSVNAGRFELDNGQYVDEGGGIFDNKFQNEDIFAPWNQYITDPQDTNKYLYESGKTDSEYYWKP